MKPFAYVDATNQAEALGALVAERGRVLPIAGGMDLLALMKDYVATPERLVNVKALDRTIVEEAGGALRIGSAVTIATLAAHPAVVARYAALAHAAAEVGSPQIRNTGTVGGNLCQRPRCWYFRNEEFACLKKGGARCFAVEGENEHHAIFGGGPCHIVHPSSLAVPAVAYGATIHIVGPRGAREVAAEEFFLPTDRSLYSETVLSPNELVTHLVLPPRPNVMAATYEVRHRQSHDWPIAFASVVLTPRAGVVQNASVVMGAVAPVPWRASGAEQVLTGKRVDAALAAAAADAAVAGATPMSRNGYKVQIARTAVKRAILQAAGLPLA